MAGNLGRKAIKKTSLFIRHHERILLALLSVVILISGLIWFKQYSASQTQSPAAGGTYVEGIVGNGNDLRDTAITLTNTGLFTVDENGQLVNHLITSWRVNEDLTEYVFTLKDGVDVNTIRDQLDANADILGYPGVAIESNFLTLTLSKPSPNLPIILSRPLFPYGPYKITKENQQTTVLSRNTSPLAVKTYINKVVLHAYESQSDLLKAVSKKKVNGALLSEKYSDDRGHYQEIRTPRYYAVLLNINQTPFRKDDVRTNLLNSSNESKITFTLSTPDAEPYRSIAEQLATDWNARGAKVDLRLLTPAELTEATNTRKFQAVLLGLNYGFELDPYYFWSSTQVKAGERNITGIKSDTVDQILTQISQSQNINERYDLINQLHQLLQTQGVALILEQEKEGFYLDNSVRFNSPANTYTIDDRHLSINWWSF